MHTCSARALINVDIAAMITHGCVEGHGITISGYPQQTMYIPVFNVVCKDRGHHNRVVHRELKVHGMLFALVISVKVESGEVGTLLQSICDNN